MKSCPTLVASWSLPWLLALSAAHAAAPVLARAQACEGTPSSSRLTVVVEGVRSAKGLMSSSLYPGDPSQFLIKNGALKVWRVPARPPATTMCIWLKAPGIYAVAVYHAANANYRLDRGPLGPTEGYGFSRNPHIFFSPPSFDAVKFKAEPGETTIHVRLHYP